MRVLNASPTDPVEEAVIFPFDESSMPFLRDLVLNLQSGRTNQYEMDYGLNIDEDLRHPEGPVLTYGPPGSPDSKEVLSPNVFYVNGEYRMWYLGMDDYRKRRTGLYAVSKDGFHWEKPNLGLVEVNGNKNNNVVEGPCGEWMLYEPEDTERPFKSISSNGENTSFSKDGIHWTATGDDRKLFGDINMEIASMFKWGGCYYVNGQNGPSAWTRSIPHPIPNAAKRTVITFASYDLVNWTHAAANTFRRDPVPPRVPESFETHNGEQIHEGMVPWNRGNVLLGLYGQWHGPTHTNDRRDVVVDLGFAISHNGIHFKEPIPDFKMVHSYEIRGPMEYRDGIPTGRYFASPRLMHNSWANTEDRTVAWFSTWREEASDWTLDNPKSLTGVWAATWERDRLGWYSPSPRNFGSKAGAYEPHCISCPIELANEQSNVFVNADRIGEYSQLRVELLDLQFQPIKGYSGSDSIPINKPGLRVPVKWKDRDSIQGFNHPIRFRIRWEGIRPEDPRLFAIYVK